MILRLLGWVSPPQKKNQKQNKNSFKDESPRLLSDNACQHPCSLWGVRNLCGLRRAARAGDAPLLRAALPFREANGREPGLVMYCVSVKLHREGFFLFFKWSGLSQHVVSIGLAWQPIPMVTSFPTNPRYPSGCNFLRSCRCRRSSHQIHLWRTPTKH